MAEYSDNFRGTKEALPCKMCGMHRDCQAHSQQCYETMKNVKHIGKYEEIFTNKISTETAEMLEDIKNAREDISE